MQVVQEPVPLRKGMIRCHTCNTAIAKSARKCPQCGAGAKKSSLGAVLGLLILGFIVAAVVLGSQAHEEKKQEVVTGVGAINVSSDQLHKDYNANEVSADASYKGKVLRVTGAVQGIKKGITNKPYLVLWTSNEFSGVHANFENDGILGSMKAGDHVTVQCRGDGMIMGSPMLDDCVMQ